MKQSTATVATPPDEESAVESHSAESNEMIGHLTAASAAVPF
jgi:hypothetical protein